MARSCVIDVRPAALVAVLAVALVGAGDARAEVPLLLQVGVRVGYAFGGGFTVGPTLSAGWGTGSVSSGQAIVFGVAGSAFVTLTPRAPASLGLSVGPELTYLNLCPVFAVPVAGGWLWSFARERAVQMGGWFSASALLSSNPNPRGYYDYPKSRSIFTGVGYRYLAPAPAAHQHEVAGLVMLPYLPGHDGPIVIGECGGN